MAAQKVELTALVVILIPLRLGTSFLDASECYSSLEMKKSSFTIGERISSSKLTVTGFEESDKHGNQRIRVVCDCGTEKTMRATALTMKTTVDKNGKVRKPHRSCGCDSTAAYKRHIHNRAIKIHKKTQRRIWLLHQEGKSFGQLAIQFPHLNAAVISEIVRWYDRDHDSSKISAVPRYSREAPADTGPSEEELPF